MIHALINKCQKLHKHTISFLLENHEILEA